MLHQKKHAKFDQKKDDFVKLEIFQGMYDQIYTKQVRTGIAIQHKEARLYDGRGNVADNDDPAAVGLPTKYKCIHPEKVIFVNETGENTNQAKSGGQKFLTTHNEW
jgi:hypothetical protein